MAEMKTLGQLWSDSWDLFSSKFKSISILSLLLAIPIVIMYILSPKEFLEPGLKFGVVNGWFILLFVALMIFTSLLLNIAVVYIASKNSKKSGISPILKYSLSKFWIAFFTSLAMTFMLLGLTLLLIIPGIIFLVYWAFTMPSLITKDLKFKKAMDYSKSVVKGRWWKALGYGIVFALIPILVHIVTSVILQTILPMNFASAIMYIISSLICSYMYVSQVVVFSEWDKHKIKN
ncbi:MAG TPA: hypothetical protein VEC16_05120 [Alphaproteobacteria bacterium]|nr:hypothetical protein [Alphaproteobacteria bacterium]